MYEEHQVAPDARHVMKHLDTRYPGEGRKRLSDLFPYGYVGQAGKIAGMKRPRGSSTGYFAFINAIRPIPRRRRLSQPRP